MNEKATINLLLQMETKAVCISSSIDQYHAEEHKTDEKDLDDRISGSLCITNFHLLC